jgi:hypothetical protein
MKSVMLSALLLLTAGAQTGGRRGVSLNQEFTLKVGQAALVRPGGLRVTLERVLEDSRCPQGVNCVWAGNARVTVGLSGPGGKPARVELNTNVEPRRQSYLRYEVELLGLSPYPKEGQKVDGKSYSVRLLVKKR